MGPPPLFDTFRKFHVTFWSGGQSDSRQKSVLDRYEDLVAEELADKSNSEILGSEFNDQMFVKLAMFYWDHLSLSQLLFLSDWTGSPIILRLKFGRNFKAQGIVAGIWSRFWTGNLEDILKLNFRSRCLDWTIESIDLDDPLRYVHLITQLSALTAS